MSQEIALSTYGGLFLALILGGETVLLPAIYLATTGTLQLPLLFVVSFSATLVADAILYILGTTIPHEDFSSHSFLGKHQNRINSLTHVFALHPFLILFTSKFVYGTRTAVQILCGMYHVPFAKYLLVNALGISTLNIVYILAAKGVYYGISQGRTGTTILVFSFVLFVAIAVVLQLLLKKYIWQKWFPQ